MKILFLCSELNLACGITKTVYLLTKNLNSKHNCSILALGGDSVSRFYKENIAVTISHCDRKYLMSFFKLFFYLIKTVKSEKIDILHSQHRYFDLVAHFVSYFTKVKTVTSVQSKVYGKKLISYKAKILIACSYSIKSHLINYFNVDPNRIVVIHNFVDENEYLNLGTTSKYSIEKSRGNIVVGYVGRINIVEKGIDILLDAFKILSLKITNITLVIVGNGKDMNFLVEYVNRNRLNVSIFDAQENIYQFLNIMDIVVMPSRVEPFGIVAIEAGIVKKAVVASRIDGLVEIISDGLNGMLFPVNDSGILAETLDNLISNRELREQLGYSLFEKVKSDFLSSVILPKYESIYRS